MPVTLLFTATSNGRTTVTPAVTPTRSAVVTWVNLEVPAAALTRGKATVTAVVSYGGTRGIVDWIQMSFPAVPSSVGRATVTAAIVRVPHVFTGISSGKATVAAVLQSFHFRNIAPAAITGSSQVTATVKRVKSGQVKVVQTTLGCGVYNALIVTRGGKELVAEVEYSSLQWSRILNDTSAAAVSVPRTSECCANLLVVRPWRHELAIFRGGVLVWVGPVFQPTFGRDGITIEARDLTAWWDHRFVHNTIDHPEATELATIFEEVSDDAMEPDPTPALTLVTSPSGALAVKTVLATDHQIAGSVIRDLTNTGIDWTTVNRTVYAGGVAVPSTITAGLVDEHFQTVPEPNYDGSAQSNRVVTSGIGVGEAGDNIYADASADSASGDDGLLESLQSLSGVEDYSAAKAASDKRLALSVASFGVSDAELATNAPLSISDLIAGRLFRLELRTTCAPVSGDYRLHSMQVTADGVGGESVSVTFQEPGG